MSDLNETSYYEIALTNRQVVVAFVILLTLVLAVFLCGVWVGQKGDSRLAYAAPAGEESVATSAELDNMKEFTFFEEKQAQQGAKKPAPAAAGVKPGAALDKPALDKPDLGRLTTTPNRDTTLAQDVGAQEKRSESPPPKPAAERAPSPRQAPPTEPPPTRPPPAQTATSTPASTPAPAAGETFVVQVFSTHDEPQALKVQSQLKQMSYRAFLSTIDMGGQTMYRVRIGPFSDRGQAEKVKVDVRNKLQLDPWVTASTN